MSLRIEAPREPALWDPQCTMPRPSPSIDASLPQATVNAATIAIAERAADLILGRE
jgi:hypothetical protein